MRLGRHKERMTWDLHVLHDGLARIAAREHKPGIGELLHILGIDLVAVAEALLAKIAPAVDLRNNRARRNIHAAQPKTRRAAKAFLLQLLGHHQHHWIRGCGIDFGRVGAFELEHIARILNHGHLHAVADPEERNAGLAQNADRLDLALGAAGAPALRHNHAVELAQGGLEIRNRPRGGRAGVVAVRGVVVVGSDELDNHARVEMRPGVPQGFFDGLVCVLKPNILAADADAHHMLWVLDLLHEILPLEHAAAAARAVLGCELELLQQIRVEPLVSEIERDLVHCGHIGARGHKVHVAAIADFLLGALRQRLDAAPNDHVGLDARLAQQHCAFLTWHCLLLVHGQNDWHMAQMDEADGMLAALAHHLARSFHERRALKMPHSPANLHHRNVRVFRRAPKMCLDLVGQMRNNLHRRAKILALALLVKHTRIDCSSCEGVCAFEILVEKAFVVTQIKVTFLAVIHNKNLSVLIWIDRSSVDVEIRVDFDHFDNESSALKNSCQ
eukprot:comp22322_c0_seq1/m.53546 comp22322_c0_seq1/g.53546  ORF comp22322_c0_seq1/g.53546 comp22322_c0_seq1/m.53546 type:complete len:501 (+) comp22322_c0_seq1:3747-5249(+)